jgi:hypothetical protein
MAREQEGERNETKMHHFTYLLEMQEGNLLS